eukprot:Blabericola_migrator_1__8305@NODE_430_length_8568_cov_132_492766_g339_i0_p4_GENE_NODE_430_length_8568_cov_132_492766_g339_i0NODE_430_length_8568_cov_132_492766_g339_i0_p4_ORF_typecomplete_len300_score59_78DHR10/PF18595_1/0_12DHR10/PF18595_1/3_1e02TrmK/PF04816_12/0_064GBP_C/PF02841_14/0_11DUF16/PF01519_16/11DUF16/PF01519_16/0_69Spc7/PF08317_11/0_28AAA_13/PF13166_6/0_58MPS2/PF17060_5/0_6AAA_23/PF13476_6/0_67UPF0242/PF06785_11/1_6TPR_MLP1_2/PF07926_12/3_9UPF0449/PF15136_6/14UPF0449/PF15136_6/29HAUS
MSALFLTRMRASRIVGGGNSGSGPPRYGPPAPHTRAVPSIKQPRTRSSSRLRPPPVDRTIDELPSVETMLETLKVLGISPSVAYTGTAPLVRRRMEDESVVNHRTLLQSGLKCQQDWKLDSPALSNMSQLVAQCIVRPFTALRSMSEEERVERAGTVEISCAELQKIIVDQCLIIARDLDALVEMAEAVSEREAQLKEQGKKLDVLREEIETKQHRHNELKACNYEAGNILKQETVPALEKKCEDEKEKIRAYGEELEERKAVHKERVKNFMEINANLHAMLEALQTGRSQPTDSDAMA